MKAGCAPFKVDFLAGLVLYRLDAVQRRVEVESTHEPPFDDLIL